MAKETRRLGRGLSSLISQTVPDPAPESADSEAVAEAKNTDSTATTVPVSHPPATDSVAPSRTQMPASPAATVEEPLAIQQSEVGIAERFNLPGGSQSSVLRVSEVVANARQPRRQFDPDSIASLAGSIARRGLLQPIVVRPVRGAERQPGDDRQYEIIAGERRWRASKAAGIDEVPAIIRDVDDEETLELALIENIQREDLNAIDRAQAYAAYCAEFGLKAEDVAERLGEDRTTVVNYMRLLELPSSVKDLVAAGQLGMGHARALLGLTTDDARIDLARAAVANALSVRALEDIVRRRKAVDIAEKSDDSGASTESRKASPHVADLENRLQQAVGTKVKIQEGRRKGHGRIVIDYYSLDDFDRISGLLGLREE